MIRLLSKRPADPVLLDPENRENLQFFSKRWGYSVADIKNAILYTGSLDPNVLSEYLRRDSFIYHPAKAIKEFYDHTRQLIF